jgi:hypothetical protein
MDMEVEWRLRVMTWVGAAIMKDGGLEQRRKKEGK